MEGWETGLAGVGALGAIAVFVLATVLFFLLPIWAIIDCAASERHRNSRGIVIILLVLTWGFSASIYGMFFAGSRALKRFAWVSTLGLGGLFVLSTGACLIGGQRASEAYAIEEQARIETLSESFRPETVAEDAAGTFPAIAFRYERTRPQAASLGNFDLGGLIAASARSVDEDVRQVAIDPATGGHFAISSHKFGTVDPSTGEFSAIEFDKEKTDFGWPKGVAFDTRRNRAVILSSHGLVRFYSYDPQTAEWTLLPGRTRRLSVAGLTYAPDEDCLYALELATGATQIERIHRFNMRGASVGTVELLTPIPLLRLRPAELQLQHTNGRLVVIVPPLDVRLTDRSTDPDRARIFAVDPTTGTVARAKG